MHQPPNPQPDDTALDRYVEHIHPDATQPHHWAMITKLRLSLLRMRLATPVERIGFLTLTFAPGTTDQEATAEFSAIIRALPAGPSKIPTCQIIRKEEPGLLGLDLPGFGEWDRVIRHLEVNFRVFIGHGTAVAHQ